MKAERGAGFLPARADNERRLLGPGAGSFGPLPRRLLIGTAAGVGTLKLSAAFCLY